MASVHLKYGLGAESLKTPTRVGWEVLPDRSALSIIAAEIVRKLHSQVGRRLTQSAATNAELIKVISALPAESIYDALIVVRGRSLPRYNCGEFSDITVPLREGMLEHLKRSI